MKIKITSDSTCDLTLQQLQDNDLPPVLAQLSPLV